MEHESARDNKMAFTRSLKRRRLTPPTSEEDTFSKPTIKPSTNEFYRRASKWNLEQDYEQRPRKSKRRDRETTRLPIKTAEGAIEHVPNVQLSEKDTDSFLDTESEGDDGESTAAETLKPSKASAKQQIMTAKEELARLALLINEDPEEHMGSLRKLFQIGEGATLPAVKKLALATQAAVYRDIIPGYRIRQLPGGEGTAKLSKEVRKLQNYEQSLLSNYHGYVRQLALAAKARLPETPSNDDGLQSVAISCTSILLKAVPHFNFRTELLRLLTDQLSTKNIDEDFNASLGAMESLFSTDEDGAPSLEAVHLLTKMMKGKDYRVDERVLNTFLHLRLLTEFSSKASSTNIDKPEDIHFKDKNSKAKREFRTKKRRKLEKERKVIEKDMHEADAIVSHEERDKMQAETLKQVFATYFRILKLRIPNLVGAVLEGLAKYAHLINQDFFGDLLEALKDLIRQTPDSDDSSLNPSRNPIRESLLCTITAFALLSGQDALSTTASKIASSLNLDLSFFIAHIYDLIYPLCLNTDLELGPSSLHLPDPYTAFKTSPRVNVQTSSLLVLRTLTSILTTSPSPPPSRLASFTKKILTSSLHTPEKTTIALVSLLQKLTKTASSRKILSPLWNTEERKGDGVYDGGVGGLEGGGNGVWNATVWEGELLRVHYCPGVRERYVKGVEVNIKEGT